jgi:hypothetical protein
MPTQFPRVFANLMPEEVIVGRRARKLQQRVLIGLGILLVLLVGWYGASVLQTSGAKGDLAAANRKATTLQAQQNAFGPLVTAQQQSAAIELQLKRLMAGDVQWGELILAIDHNLPKGVRLSSVTGTLSDGTTCTCASLKGGLQVLNQTGRKQIGSMSLVGNAPDKNTVAAYLDFIAKVPGLAVPYPTTVADSTTGVTWSATVILTADLLGGRYTAATQGGH